MFQTGDQACRDRIEGAEENDGNRCRRLCKRRRRCGRGRHQNVQRQRRELPAEAPEFFHRPIGAADFKFDVSLIGPTGIPQSLTQGH